jgi:hypothetical protein
MLDFSLKIECNNDAFVSENGLHGVSDTIELRDCLTRLVKTLGDRAPIWPGDEGPIIDANGNVVGRWIFQ